jgi:wobble nucleotide-excising tRNase
MNDDLEIMWDKIKTQRDELRVRSHLAKAEFRDEWQELELKWETAEKNLNHLQKEAKETTEDVKTSAKIVLEELSSAYDRIKNRLKD